MKLSNQKNYNVEAAMESLQPQCGATFWLGDNEIKPDFVDLTFTEEELDEAGNVQALTDAKKARCTDIMAARQSAMTTPSLYDGKHYDPVFMLSLESWIQFMDIDPDVETLDTRLVITDENTNEQLGKADLINRCTHLRARNDAIALAARQMKDDIAELTSVQAVQEYEITI